MMRISAHCYQHSCTWSCFLSFSHRITSLKLLKPIAQAFIFQGRLSRTVCFNHDTPQQHISVSVSYSNIMVTLHVSFIFVNIWFGELLRVQNYCTQSSQSTWVVWNETLTCLQYMLLLFISVFSCVWSIASILSVCIIVAKKIYPLWLWWWPDTAFCSQ